MRSSLSRFVGFDGFTQRNLTTNCRGLFRGGGRRFHKERPQVGGRPRSFCSAKAEAPVEEIPRPSPLQLRRLFVNCAVPFIGFGIVDQSVLIYAGDHIDNTLGVRFGLPTLGAAACGQIFSDTSGVLFGGTIEAMALRCGLPVAGLTVAQQSLGVVKRVSMFGSVCGVITGCLIGMGNLLIVDLHAAERAKRAEELKTIMKTVMEDGRKVVHCARATMWVVDDDKEELWSWVAQGSKQELRISLSKKSIAGWVYNHRLLTNVDDVVHDSRWGGDKNAPYVPTTMICAPVVCGDKVVAVIQFLDKTSDDGVIIAFDKNDEKLVTMMVGHTRVFMEEM